jgi:GH43 family beta-xylosidase
MFMDNALGKNPFIESIFTADPSARTWDGETVYVYASHDMDPARGCDLMDRYHIFSSKDMLNWTDEGEILRSDDVSWGRPEGGFMWAPDCVYRNGLYYFYFPHPSETRWNDTWKIGVAVSKYPHKGFTDKGYIEGLGGFALIDPCVFIDDDGQAYIYVGGGARYQGAKLNDDMVSLKTPVTDMEGLEDFHEASWVFKRNGIYYMSYSDNTQPQNNMRYAISDNPLGPWTHKGIYLTPVGCETTHGSVMEFKGQWYQFYHNQDISGRGNLRSVCVDKLFFEENGDIRTVAQTRDGKRYFNIPENAARYPAGSLRVFGGARVEKSECGECIKGLSAEVAGFALDNADGKTGGRATIWVCYRADALAKLRMSVNGRDESLINLVSDNSAGGNAARLTVLLEPGTVNKIEFTGGNGEAEVTEAAVSWLDD